MYLYITRLQFTHTSTVKGQYIIQKKVFSKKIQRLTIYFLMGHRAILLSDQYS